jgi:hypothetical protein
MCCRDWARDLFNETLKQNNIQYELRPERLAFYCYHMFFLYLGEFLEDFIVHGKREEIENYFDGFMIRPLAKLSNEFKITDAADKIKPQAEAFSAVAIPIGDDFKAFDKPDNVFIENAIA